MTRRLALAAAALAVACGRDDVLVYGPLVGDTTPSTAIVWTRLPGPGVVTVDYGRAPDLADAERSEAVEAEPDHDYTVHVPLRGLQAGTRYYYRVNVDGAATMRSTLPSFRTAPAGRAAFTVAAGSCARFPRQPIFDEIARHAPDLFLMIGDAHYADTTDLGLLRAAYQRTRTMPELVRLVSRTPTWAVWDDHDYAGDDTDGHAEGKEASLRAFLEYWANPSAGSDGVDGIWFRFAWGGVDFFMLDTRYWRDDGGSTLLGPTQLAWLLDGLDASSAPFKVIVSTSEVHAGGAPDTWASFPEERAQILDHVMGHGIGGVLLLSGDRHHSALWRIDVPSVPGAYPVYELVSSGLAVTPSPCDPAPAAGRIFCADDDNYFALLRFRADASPAAVTLEVRDTKDALRFALELHEDELQVR